MRISCVSCAFVPNVWRAPILEAVESGIPETVDLDSDALDLIAQPKGMWQFDGVEEEKRKF